MIPTIYFLSVFSPLLIASHLGTLYITHSLFLTIFAYFEISPQVVKGKCIAAVYLSKLITSYKKFKISVQNLFKWNSNTENVNNNQSALASSLGYCTKTLGQKMHCRDRNFILHTLCEYIQSVRPSKYKNINEKKLLKIFKTFKLFIKFAKILGAQLK